MSVCITAAGLLLTSPAMALGGIFGGSYLLLVLSVSRWYLRDKISAQGARALRLALAPMFVLGAVLVSRAFY